MLKEYYEKYKQFLPLVSIGIAIILIILFVMNTVLTDDQKVSINENESAGEASAEENQEPGEIIEPVSNYVFVEVKGAVKNPGVFEVPSDARVTNVLSLAVLLETADLLTVNQSEKVKDEMVIYVPEEGEVESSGIQADAAGIQTSEEKVLVNINTATAEELTLLNGIGEKKAQLILDYREQNGLFMAKEDLMNISGIGEKTFDSLDPYITIE